MSNKNKADMLSGDIGRTLKQMTVPVVYGMILLMTFSLVDTFFVSLLGTQQLAAISFTFPVTFTLVSLTIGLGIGTSATIARYLGSGDSLLAREFATGALILSLILVGVLAAAGIAAIEPIFRLLGATDEQLPYIYDYMLVWYLAGVCLALPMVGNSVLRASGDTKTPSLIMALSGFINAVLDPLLIFGWGPVPAMGIQGAALATLIAWAVGVIVILVLLIKRNLMLPRLLTFAEMKLTSTGILKIGLPAAGANMMTPIAGGVMTAIVASYGPSAVAAWGVGSRIESIASIVVLALSMSLPPFISQNFGAMKIRRVEHAYKLCLKFIMLWQLLMFVLMWVVSPWIAAVFTSDEQVAEVIKLFLLIVPLGYGLQGVIILTNSSFNAMHKPMSALSLSIIRLFVLFVPISYLGSAMFGLIGMFWAGIAANLLTAFIAYVWFTRAISEQLEASVYAQAKESSA